MSKELSSNARRVRDTLEAMGFTFKVAELPASTRTAGDAAKAIGCQVQNIAKSLVFEGKNTGSPILVIASGTNRVDEEKLSLLAGEQIEKANADFVRQHTGFAIGGVSPVGHIKNLDTFIDEDLFNYELIWAAAGTPHAVFELKPADLLKMTNGKVVDVKL